MVNQLVDAIATLPTIFVETLAVSHFPKFGMFIREMMWPLQACVYGGRASKFGLWRFEVFNFFVTKFVK